MNIQSRHKNLSPDFSTFSAFIFSLSRFQCQSQGRHKNLSPGFSTGKMWSFHQFLLLCLLFKQLKGAAIFIILFGSFVIFSTLILTTMISTTLSISTTLMLSSYHLLGFERHAANFLLANLHPSSVIKVFLQKYPVVASVELFCFLIRYILFVCRSWSPLSLTPPYATRRSWWAVQAAAVTKRRKK